MAASALGALIVPRHVLGGTGYQAPSDTLRIAAIGVGGMGRRYIAGCNSERIEVLCDIDHSFAAPVFETYPHARVYSGFRQMLEKEEKNIDAVIVATPDHSHACITMQALKLRKPVYCAKPLTHTVHEARAISNAAREAKVATQMSVQSCASDDALSTAEILLSGVIGQVREVHVWTPHPIYPAAEQRPLDTPSVPYAFDWDMWIGPAPFRPYHPAYHPWIWRCWWDFGGGTVADMLCHAMHVFYSALKLESPRLVSASRSTMYGGYFHMLRGGKEDLPRKIETPETESYSNLVTWEFPERHGMPVLQMIWYDGGLRPPRPVELDRKAPIPAEGLLFIGDKGKLLSGYYGGKNRLLPEKRFQDFQAPPKSLPRTVGHYKEWINACKTGSTTNVNFEFGSRMTEIALLGTIAARTTRLLEYDSERQLFIGDKEASSFLNPPYRQGWSL